MNPKRGVQTDGLGLRAGTVSSDRANRYVSVEESCRRLDPMRSAHGRVVKANESPGTERQRRHAKASVSAVKSLSSTDSSNLERSWVPVRRSTPGS